MRREALILVLVVGGAFLPGLTDEFTTWDDGRFVVDNLLLRSWSWHNVSTWLTEPVAGKWRPGTWVSFALDRTFWGSNPMGYRVSALLLHLLGVLLVHRLARSWDLAPPAAVLAALLWGVHPLVVEPVCWITARNYLLGQVLVLAAVLLSTSSRPRWRGLGVAATVAALACHELAVVAPLLVGLEAWRRRSSPRVALPHLGAALLLGSVHLWMVQRSGILVQESLASPLHHLVASLADAVWPLALSPVYDAASLTSPARRLACGVSLVLLTLLVTSCRQDRRAWAALLWIVLAALPTAGVLQVRTGHADRWLYLPLVGLALLVAVALSRRARLLPVATWLLIPLCVAGSVLQQRHWHDSRSLWSRAVAVSPCHLSHHNLAGALLAPGGLPDVQGALGHYQRARELAPDDLSRARSSLGIGRVWLKLEQPREAARWLEEAVVTLHDHAPARALLAQAYLGMGAPRQARLHAEEARKAAPDNPVMHLLVLRCARAAGAPEEELAVLERAYRSTLRRELEGILACDPGDEEARQRLRALEKE